MTGKKEGQALQRVIDTGQRTRSRGCVLSMCTRIRIPFFSDSHRFEIRIFRSFSVLGSFAAW